VTRWCLPLLTGLLALSPLSAEGTGNEADSLARYGSYQSSLGEFSLYFPVRYGLQLRDRIRDTVEDVALALTTRFGPVHQRWFEVVAVDSKEQLSAWSGMRLPDWIQAMALEYPPRVVILGPASKPWDPSVYQFEQTLLHELTHIYLYRLAPRMGENDIPGWFHEGLAVSMAGGMDRGQHWAIIRARILNRLYSLEDLDQIHHSSAGLSELAYAQAVMAVRIMESKYGAGIYLDLFDHLRRGTPFPEAFRLAAGEDLLQFRLYYRDEIRRRYNVLVVLSDTHVLVILLPVLVIAAYLVRRQRNRMIKARWQVEESSSDEGMLESSLQASEDTQSDS
jgi:hypothetical protein